jgi:hypothetical protein
MIPVERLRTVVGELLGKSKKDEVRWMDAGEQGGIQRYRVYFELASLGVGYQSPPTEPDTAWVWVFNEPGVCVAVWRVADGEPDWELVRELFLEAQRSVTKWDQALASIEGAVRSEGPVGGPDPHEPPF